MNFVEIMLVAQKMWGIIRSMCHGRVRSLWRNYRLERRRQCFRWDWGLW